MILLATTSVIVFLLFSRSKRLFYWRYYGMILVSSAVVLMLTLISLQIIGWAEGQWIWQFGLGGGLGEPWLNIPDGAVWQCPIPFSFPLTTTMTCHYPEIYVPEHPSLIFQYQLYFYTLKIADIYDLNSIGLKQFLSSFLMVFHLLGLVAGIIITSFYEVYLKKWKIKTTDY